MSTLESLPPTFGSKVSGLEGGRAKGHLVGTWRRVHRCSGLLFCHNVVLPFPFVLPSLFYFIYSCPVPCLHHPIASHSDVSACCLFCPPHDYLREVHTYCSTRLWPGLPLSSLPFVRSYFTPLLAVRLSWTMYWAVPVNHNVPGSLDVS